MIWKMSTGNPIKCYRQISFFMRFLYRASLILWVLLWFNLSCCLVFNCNNFKEIQPCSDRRSFIFGLGYVGRAVAETLQQAGWKVTGTCHNELELKIALQLGANPIRFDDFQQVEDKLSSCSVILSTIPPIPEAGDVVLNKYRETILKSTGRYNWIGYLSTTGVYSDCDGNRVKESDRVHPTNAKSILRHTAELDWQNLYSSLNLPVHIFRLSGVYGLHRNAVDIILRSNKSLLLVDDETITSRIHVDDVAQILLASMNQPSPGDIYNVADDCPCSKHEVLSYAADLLNTGIKIERSSSHNHPLCDVINRGGSKRIDNTKIRKLLHDQGLSLLYPNYRIGLQSILSHLHTL